MRPYKLNIYSTTNHNLTIFVGLIIGLAFLAWTVIEQISIPVSFGSFIIFMIIIKLLALKFNKAIAEFTITDNGFTIKWIKHFDIFSHPDYDFQFSNLQEYVFESWGETERLKVKTLENKTLKFEFKHSRKEFDNHNAFIKDFKAAVIKFNNSDNDPTNDVNPGKTFWESTPAKIVAIGLTLIILYVWGDILFSKEGSVNANMPKLIILTFAGAMYIGRIVAAHINWKDK